MIIAMMLRMALAQVSTKLGDVPANLEKHLAYIRRARKAGAHLIVFPRALPDRVCAAGSGVGGRLPAEKDDPVFRSLLRASLVIDIAVGFVEEDVRNRFYISSAYLSRGEVVHVHRKVYLPTYGMFDEGRFFALGRPGAGLRHPLRPDGHAHLRGFLARLAALPALAGRGRPVPVHVLLARARPGRGRRAGDRRAGWNGSTAATPTCSPPSWSHTNKVGFEDGLNFWGGAMVFDPNGRQIAKGPYHEEALTLAELDLNQLHRTRARLPLLRDERTALMQRELQRILGRIQPAPPTCDDEENHGQRPRTPGDQHRSGAQNPDLLPARGNHPDRADRAAWWGSPAGWIPPSRASWRRKRSGRPTSWRCACRTSNPPPDSLRACPAGHPGDRACNP